MMRKEDHEQLVRNVEQLRQLLDSCTTESIVGACFAYWLTRESAIDDSHRLMSAGRQWPFLLGLMLNTTEASEPHPFNKDELDRACNLLDDIFSAYSWAYFPAPGEEVTDDWRRSREVAMPAFLAYFNQGFLASTDQVEERIFRYLSPFDSELSEELGLSASDAIAVCRWISDTMQNAADKLVETARREKEARIELLDRAEQEGWDVERLRA